MSYLFASAWHIIVEIIHEENKHTQKTYLW